MRHTQRELEDALVRLKFMRDSNIQIIDFAQKHNKLDLYKAAEVDIIVLNIAIDVIEAEIESMKPRPA